jgi:hypothetical protein
MNRFAPRSKSSPAPSTGVASKAGLGALLLALLIALPLGCGGDDDEGGHHVRGGPGWTSSPSPGGSQLPYSGIPARRASLTHSRANGPLVQDDRLPRTHGHLILLKHVEVGTCR